MKKLFAVLLAMMMPLCAMAETYCLTLTVDTDDVLFPMYMKQALLEQPDLIPADDVDVYVRLMQHLTNGLGLQVTMQENAVAMDAQVAGGNLIDLVLHASEDAMYLTSTLLPGYAMTEESDHPSADRLETSADSEVVNWDTISISVQNAIDAWLANLKPTVSTGTFAGDAYEGGTVCMTWMLTDSDIAALVSSTATEELRRGISSVCESTGVDAAALFSQFDERNAAVADVDAYMYILRKVTDAAGELRGLSLTILEDVAQIVTVSIGFTKKDMTLVLGLGLAEQNYWWQFTAKKNERNNITFLSGASREWMADKTQSFPYVSTTNAPLTAYEWHCNVTKSGNRYLWDASVYEDNDRPDYRYLFSSSGSLNPKEQQLDGSISWGDSPYVPLTLKFKFCPVEPIAPLDPSLTLCSVSEEEDEQLSQELSNRFTAALMARLIKLLPLDLVMMINQLSMPK